MVSCPIAKKKQAQNKTDPYPFIESEFELENFEDKVDVIEKLIEMGADVNMKNQFNETVLHIAAKIGT